MSVLSEDIVRITSRSINELNELVKGRVIDRCRRFFRFIWNVLSQVGNNDGDTNQISGL